MNFFYFLPSVHRQDLNRDKVVSLGLGDVLRDRLTANDLAGIGGLAVSDVVHGPGGHSGTILYPMSELERVDDPDRAPLVVGYYPGAQTWEPSGPYYVGWVTDDLPTPEGLERDLTLRGYDETLGDGRNWLCPMIRMRDGLNNLPDTWGIKNGKFCQWVKPDWQWAWDLTGEIWDYFEREADIPHQLAFEWAVKLLSINYRIGPVEATALKLFGRVEFKPVLQAAISGPFVEKVLAAQKKIAEMSAGSGVSSSPGSEG